MTSRTIRRCVMWVAVFSACAPHQVEAQAISKVPHPKNGKPAAFFGVLKDYPRELTYPVESGIALANGLHDCGYRVTLTTGKDCIQNATAKLNASIDASQESSSVAELGVQIDNWLKSVFEGPTRAPFGLLVLSGHGEVRNGEQFFMTPTDRAGEGGLSIRGLQTAIGSRRLPVVLIIDCCRSMENANPSPVLSPNENEPKGHERTDVSTGMNKSSVEAMVKRSRGNRFQINRRKGDVDDKHAKWSPLTVYATAPLRPAADTQFDLLGTLALGLKDPEGPAAFEARLHSTIPLEHLGRRFRDQDLSLCIWFNYAMVRIGTMSESEQVVHVERGYIDQSMVIAARDGIYDTQPPIDLLASWREFAAADLATDVDAPNHVVITRTPGTRTGRLSATSFLDSVDVNNGMSVLIEVMARSDKDRNDNGLMCLFQPGNNLLKLELSQFSSRWSKPQPIPWNRPARLVIPLDNVPKGSSLLTSMAISVDPQSVVKDPNGVGTWPEGCSVTVTRMILLGNNNAALKSGITDVSTSAYDLVPRTWLLDILREKNESQVTAGIEFQVTKATSKVNSSIERTDPRTRILKMSVLKGESGRAAGKGGPIYPEIPVGGSRFRLEMVVKSFKPTDEKSKSCIVIVLLESNGRTAATMIENVDPSKIGKRIYCDIDFGGEMNRSGVADYLALTTDAAELELSSLAIVPQSK